MNSNISTNGTPRFSQRYECPHCHQSKNLFHLSRIVCLNCGSTIEPRAEEDIDSFRVVGETLSILLIHRFAAQGLIQEAGRIGNVAVKQQRMELVYPLADKDTSNTVNRFDNITCSVRWAIVNWHGVKEFHRRWDKTNAKLLRCGTVPNVVQQIANELRGLSITQLKLGDCNLDPEYKGRNFIRLEQAYASPDNPTQDSLILRVEFSWDTALAASVHSNPEGIPPRPRPCAPARPKL
jgi:hypothetical protein